MEIGPFISNLLYENDKVVLPNFGEFSTKYIPARFVPEEKKIEAPRKQIDFNPDVRQGEPVLANLIASVTGVQFQTVEGKIESFVAELLSALDNGKQAKLAQVGLFFKNPDGTLFFEPDTSVNYLSDSTGLDPVSSPTMKVKSKVIEENPIVLAPVQPANETISVEFYKPDEMKEEPTFGSAMKVTTEENEPEKIRATQKRKKKPGCLLVFLGVLVISLIAYFLWPIVSKPFKIKQQVIEQAVPPEAEVQLAPEPGPISNPFDLKPFIPESGVATYFIVVGAFPSLELAEAKAKEFRDAGGIYARPFMVTESGNHRVSYGYFYDLNEAEAELAKVKEKGLKDAYIFRHRPR